MTEGDWRLTGQQRYLPGACLQFREYLAPSSTWDHDHCEFCWAKFKQQPSPKIGRQNFLTAGYFCENSRSWICERCFFDFKTVFRWAVSEAADDASKKPPTREG